MGGSAGRDGAWGLVRVSAVGEGAGCIGVATQDSVVERGLACWAVGVDEGVVVESCELTDERGACWGITAKR